MTGVAVKAAHSHGTVVHTGGVMEREEPHERIRIKKKKKNWGDAIETTARWEDMIIKKVL